MNQITISAEVNAALRKVWDCYTKPEHITQWNFADPSWHCPSASNDLRVGGKYSARMEAKDKSWGFDFEAVYDEVSFLKTLGYTIADGRKVKVSFNGNTHQTEVTIQFDPENQHPAEMQRDGWQAILNSFKKYAEGK